MTIRRNKKKTYVLLTALLFIFPLSLNAGFFSLGITLGSSNPQREEPKQVTKKLTSQTLPILQAATSLDPDPAKGGADIQTVENKALVYEAGVGGGFVEISERKNDQISVYEVKDGDTLSQISEMFGVSANTIRWANDFEGPIHPGQRLVILPISGIKHKVKSGGTIGDIAKIYNADIREIALFNGISEGKYLEAGTEIIVPNAEPEVKASEKPKTKSSGGTKKETGSNYAVESWMVRPISGGYRSQGIHGYNGVDLAAKSGTGIVAAASGKVIISKSSGWNGGYGNYVVIEHSNGVQTLYAHMLTVSVKQGQWVGQGETIGSVGNTGKSTGDHVHFEVRGGKNPF